uniref:Ion_trans domain-containing protein n=1 Tax=Rodentolepis nana TaxID=102285 RepID=A0A0R3T9N2_RODNA
LDIVPIKNEKGQVVLFLVSHKDLTAQKATGIGASLLSCGLASTLGPAALVAKRQPQLEIPSGNQIPHRVVPIRRGHPSAPITTCHTMPSALSSRRASAPHTVPNKRVRVRFGSEYGIPRESPVKPKELSSLPGAFNPESFIQSPQSLSPTSPLALPTQSPINHFLSKKSETQATSKTDTSSSSSSSSKSSDSENEETSSTFKYQRRRSRAVLYHLSGRFDKKHKPGKLNLKCVLPHLSTKNSIPEYKVQDLKSSCCILLHYSILKIVWDWLIVLCTFYFAIMVPYNAAFHRDGNERYLRTLDMIIEVLFIIDILLNFRTTFVSKSGHVVHRSKEIALNYIRGWFILDLIAAVPFDIIKTIQNPESPVVSSVRLSSSPIKLRSLFISSLPVGNVDASYEVGPIAATSEIGSKD